MVGHFSKIFNTPCILPFRSQSLQNSTLYVQKKLLQKHCKLDLRYQPKKLITVVLLYPSKIRWINHFRLILVISKLKM